MQDLMEKLFIYKEVEIGNFGKDTSIGCSLVPAHPMVTKLIKKAHKITLENGYYTREDIGQEVALVIIEATKKFIYEGQITEKYIIQNLNNDDETMAKYWSYIDIRLQGHIRDILKIKDKSGPQEALNREYDTFSAMEENEGIKKLELIMANSYDSDVHNAFSRWFLNNKENILTQKQLKYLNNPNIVDSRNRARINKTIANRVIVKYEEEMMMNNKELELTNNINILEDIVEGNLVKGLRRYQNNDFLIETLIDKRIKEDEYKLITKAIKEEMDFLPLDLTIKLLLILDLKKSKLMYILKSRKNKQII